MDEKDFSKYGLMKNPFKTTIFPTQFSKDYSKLIIKDDLDMGTYAIDFRPPEHSSMKLDLRDGSGGVKQVRVLLSKKDWERLALEEVFSLLESEKERLLIEKNIARINRNGQEMGLLESKLELLKDLNNQVSSLFSGDTRGK